MTRLHSVLLVLVTIYLTGFPCAASSSDQNFPLTQQCLACICEAISSCDTTTGCTGNVCGPFRITWAYWSDAGKPTVNDEAPESSTAHTNCTVDTYCSILTVQKYMHNFQQDCNNDGKIDCDDFAAIHKLGGYGCKMPELPEVYGQRYHRCKQKVGA
ncbi:lysozyme 2-like isoform X1 [Tenebrio molitor]|uniref:lysozyme n=1 Tax=Tenebrio molitor TaxID=7067 RepID=A0A8J6HIG8_TENMO|nr:hypothetical protein GEV33_007540 [Tenebrio molitor]CAH1377255.1 unnamed protein product [Tenebrio molitor]